MQVRSTHPSSYCNAWYNLYKGTVTKTLGNANMNNHAALDSSGPPCSFCCGMGGAQLCTRGQVSHIFNTWVAALQPLHGQQHCFSSQDPPTNKFLQTNHPMYMLHPSVP